MSPRPRFIVDDPAPAEDHRLRCDACDQVCLPYYQVPYDRAACVPGVMPAESEFERLCVPCCRKKGVPL